MTGQTGIGPEKATDDKIKCCNALCKKRGLTAAQFDVLRKAARKYHNFRDEKDGLHTGQVEEYGVNPATLRALREYGAIDQGYRWNNPEERRLMEERAQGLVIHAWLVANGEEDAFKDAGPGISTEVNGIPAQGVTMLPSGEQEIRISSEFYGVAWAHVLKQLKQAEELYTRLRATCLLITEQGRALAVEWKAAVGATEE